MIYYAKRMEESALLDIAQLMCAAAKTAPKAKGKDNITSLVLTGSEILELADKMEEIDWRLNGDNRTFFTRDANNLRKCSVVVLIGVKSHYYGLNCKYCGYENCAECEKGCGTCSFGYVDLGIAIGSAVSTAASMKADSRVMYTIGKAAAEMDYLREKHVWFGIPLSISSKSPFFDRG